VSSGLMLRSLVLFFSLLLVGYILKSTELGAVFDEAWIDVYVRGQRLDGYLILVWYLRPLVSRVRSSVF
jgi:hypothetical protein